MEILNKSQIENKFGKFGFWKNKEYLNQIEYLGGIPFIDNFIETKNIERKSISIYLEIRPLGLEIGYIYVFNTTRTGILFKNINYWTIEHQKEISVKKSKSIIGRALLGGLLLGPVGAIIGGMTGVGDKSIKLSDVDNIISFSINDEDKESIILFSCTNKKLKKVFDFLKMNFPDKYKNPE